MFYKNLNKFSYFFDFFLTNNRFFFFKKNLFLDYKKSYNSKPIRYFSKIKKNLKYMPKLKNHFFFNFYKLGRKFFFSYKKKKITFLFNNNFNLKGNFFSNNFNYDFYNDLKLKYFFSFKNKFFPILYTGFSNNRKFFFKILFFFNRKNLKYFFNFKFFNFFFRKGFFLDKIIDDVDEGNLFVIFFDIYSFFLNMSNINHLRNVFKFPNYLKNKKKKFFDIKLDFNHQYLSKYNFFSSFSLDKIFYPYSSFFFKNTLNNFTNLKNYNRYINSFFYRLNFLTFKKKNEFIFSESYSFFCKINYIKFPILLKNNSLNYSFKHLFFKSFFLKKSRLYFFFKFFFKTKHILKGYFKKNSFFKEQLLKYPIQTKGLYLSQDRIDLSFFFFLV